MKFKKGSFYTILFYDHALDANIDEEIKCEVVGKVLLDREKSVVLCCWDVVGADDHTRRGNQTRFTVMKSCIIKRKLLR